MIPEEGRYKIARVCGWTYRQIAPGSPLFWHNLEGIPKGAHEVPDFFNDLNAIYEAEKVLTEDQNYTYLEKIVGKSWFDPWTITDVLKVRRAPANQLAAAFLEAVGE